MNVMTDLYANHAFTQRLIKSNFIKCIEESMIDAFDSSVMKEMKIGEMQPVLSTIYHGFLIKTKTGNLSMFRLYDGNIHYRAEDSLAICQSWKNAGFSDKGIIETPAQLAYIFAIPDSYL